MSLTNKKQQLNIKIKGFKNEYQEISEINNSVYSDRPISPEEFIEFDTNRNKKCKHRRWIAIIDNKIVGTGVFTQEIWQYHPDKFYIWMMVKPEYQNIGVGSKLYDRIWKSLEKFNPISVNTDARNDMPQADRFIKERGYKSFQRYAEPHLEVSSFDFAPYESLMEKIKSEGIIIKTMQELENDPDRNHKIYEMDQEIAADMPDEDGFTKLDYETYRKENLEASYTNPDSYFIALENGNYIGVSVLFKFKQNKDLYTGLTGVRRPYRRRGIATCLKVKAIEYAKKHNFAKIGTDNQSTNKPMRDLNDKLGFKKQYDWICYKKVIRQENATEK